MSIFVLYLNDMRDSNIENVQPVARAATAEALQAFMNREQVAPWRDGPWGKCYRHGGPLEWFNAPMGFGGGITDCMTLDEFLESSRQWFEQNILSVPEVTNA